VSRMKEDILSPEYWRYRLRTSPEEVRHHAIFRCPLPHWREIEEAHRKILAEKIGPEDSILDAGCGWGRLLSLLPPWWRGAYLGVDLSPDFIALARKERPDRTFLVGDLRNLSGIGERYDWAIAISIRPMMNRHLGEETWQTMRGQLRRAARKVLYLEYDATDPGHVEEGEPDEAA
jgi:cyclopropane fatty-acyl-phospholipid synthase-like methyltransferase